MHKAGEKRGVGELVVVLGRLEAYQYSVGVAYYTKNRILHVRMVESSNTTCTLYTGIILQCDG